MESKTLKIKKVRPDAIIPTKGSKYAAGYDLYANISFAESDLQVVPDGEIVNAVLLNAGETRFFHTGIAVQLPPYTFGGIYARSGLACKHGARPANCVGVVDEDYNDEILVALHNDSDKCLEILHGDRIAQLIVQPVIKTKIDIVDTLDETERGGGGFGSTGR